MKSRFSRSEASELDIPLRLQKQQRESGGGAAPPQPLHSHSRSMPDTAAAMTMMIGPHRASPSEYPLPVVGEDCVITPCASPQTPREVLWEKQYGSFLLRKNGTPPPLFPPLGPVKRNRSSGSSGSSSSTAVLSPLTSSPPDTLHHTNKHTMGKEKSVRAGKFFSGGFFPPRRGSSKGSAKGGSRDALDDTRRNGIERRTSQKKAFTDFHNSAGASEAPFLGDGDRSTHAGLHMLCAAAQQQVPKPRTTTTTASIPLSRSLERIHPMQQRIQQKSVLRPLTGVESWQSGRRYLIVPAVLATCSDTTQERILLGHDNDDLGDCLVRIPPAGEWKQVRLQLRHNYLLEYESGTTAQRRPRGCLHLAAATITLHPDFPDTIQVEYKNETASTNSSNKTSMLLIRVSSDRATWYERLQRSRQCSITDLYEYDADTPLLGQGEYAVVRAGRRKRDNMPCALKVFTKSSFWKRVLQGHERADTIVREAAVQFTVASSNSDSGTHCPIVQIRDILETTDHVVLEMELLKDTTDLFQFVRSHTALSEHDTAPIILDIGTALHRLNSTHGIAHRDVKPANILVHTSTKQAKLCDFGMAAFGGADGRIRGRCGTPGTCVMP